VNRRGFLKRFGVGVTAALALAAVPKAAIAALDTVQAGKCLALQYMRKVYNEYSAKHRAFPRLLHVSPGLHAAFESELLPCERFCVAGGVSGDTAFKNALKFKGAAVTIDPALRGWQMRVVEAVSLG